MDSAIDPEIQGGSESPKEDSGVSNDMTTDTGDVSEPIDNMITLNQYMKGSDEDENGSDIRQGSDQSGTNDVDTDATALNIIELANSGEGHLVDLDGHELSSAEIKELVSQGEDKLKDKTRNIHMVEYNPKNKSNRIGRPRGHALSNIKVSGSNDSSENLEKSSVHLYKLNNQPLVGPGSRGAQVTSQNTKKRGQVTSKDKSKKLKQSQLNFPLKSKSEEPQRSQNNDSSDKRAFSESIEDKPNDKDDKDEPKPSVPKLKKQPNNNKLVSTSRTTVVNNRHKVSKQFPGPVIPLYYDLYDENLINSSTNKECREETLSLGFPVTPAAYGGDILFLVSYLSKFNDVIKLDNIGPQDIELGLSLPSVSNNENYDPNYVSPVMNALFSRLVTLVLNRKSEVNSNLQGKAVSELKSVCSSLGLPKEWKDANEVFRKRKLDPNQASPVDESNPDILLDESYVYQAPYVYENPFNDKQGFEKNGFSRISDPVDRLIMLRTLAQWSLTSSNEIKTFVSETVQNQDIPGDKETIYCSRAVLKGFQHTENLTKEINTKIEKKKYNPENEMVMKYLEPSSDPLAHPLRLRVDEMVVGDCGFHIGRFFLCRMAKPDNGGLSSIRKMSQVTKYTNDINLLPSKFKLYVQDTYRVLSDQLQKEGIEFNDQGDEVIVNDANDEEQKGEPETYNEKSQIFEVASNVEELESFIIHLQKRLGIIIDDTQSQSRIISATSMIYKPILNMYEYLANLLPLLSSQEEVQQSQRKRRRTVDYSDANASKRIGRLINDYEHQEGEEEEDDDDVFGPNENFEEPEGPEDVDYDEMGEDHEEEEEEEDDDYYD